MLDIVFAFTAPTATMPEPDPRAVKRHEAIRRLAALCARRKPQHTPEYLIARFENPVCGEAQMRIVAGKVYEHLIAITHGYGKLNYRKRMARVDLAQLEAITAELHINFCRNVGVFKCHKRSHRP